MKTPDNMPDTDRTPQDDPRLTAYILNELSPEEEAALEAEFATNPALEEEAKAIALFCTDLVDELAAEAEADATGDAENGDGQLELADTQRRKVLATAAAAARARQSSLLDTKKPGSWWKPSLTAAAVLAVLVGITGAVWQLNEKPTHSDIDAVASRGAAKYDRAVVIHPPTGVPGDMAPQLDDVYAMEPSELPADQLAANTRPALPGMPDDDYPAPSPPPMEFAIDELDGATPQADIAHIPAKPTHGYNIPAEPAQPEPSNALSSFRNWVKPSEDPGNVPPPQRAEAPGAEEYVGLPDNSWQTASQKPLSTFSVDVDTASYSNVRRMLTQGQLPPAAAVRVEEMVNYFDYAYEQPTDGRPFATNVAVTTCPWNTRHRLARVALKGQEMHVNERPASNLVFLLDVSGSMNSPKKLPLVQRGMTMLTEALGRHDRVAIVTYAGNSGLVLPSTAASNQRRINQAITNLRPGGSTNGGAGIDLAYRIAQENYIEGGVNRVILCTDGDFNVGTTNRDSLQALIEQKAKSGVFLSVLGFGMGNLKDGTLETLADKGNGNYAYIDSEREAYKVLNKQLSGTLVTIAKDVKIQIEFNPRVVAHYRLIGYENRMLAKEDFNDDTKDAGEIGAGHTVTALYELALTDDAQARPEVDPLRYQPNPAPERRRVTPGTLEMMYVKLRYKLPNADTSTKVEQAVVDRGGAFDTADSDLQFAAAVAAFGQKLRGSEHLRGLSYAAIAEIADAARGRDPDNYRQEFVSLVRRAASLDNRH